MTPSPLPVCIPMTTVGKIISGDNNNNNNNSVCPSAYPYEILLFNEIPQSLSGGCLASEVIQNLISADTTAQTKALCNTLFLKHTHDSFHFLLYINLPKSLCNCAVFC